LGDLNPVGLYEYGLIARFSYYFQIFLAVLLVDYMLILSAHFYNKFIYVKSRSV
jgi:hypothetical protein